MTYAEVDQAPVGPIGRLIARVFPKTPDFYSLLAAQSGQAVLGMEALVEYMQDGSRATGKAVKLLESQSDDMRDQSMAALNSAFSTPMDREDLYRAIATLDHLLGYAKSTVREMEVLGVSPDQYTLLMAEQLLVGARHIHQGYEVLSTNTAEAEPYAQSARSAEREIEKLYRKALKELFDVEKEMAALGTIDGPSGPATLGHVVDIFKRREIYRHLSNAGDRVAHAGDALHDIVVKLV
ncbi:MAG: DUF47 family protein [Nocardioides sp.]